MPITTVRLATEGDIPTLRRFDEWPTPLAWRQRIACEQVIVIEDYDQQVRGVVRYTNLWTTVPFLELIYVETSHQGQGYSRLLLNHLIADLRTRGFVALLSSSQTNEPTAQAWHHHVGFRSNGIIEHIADDNVGEIVYRMEL